MISQYLIVRTCTQNCPFLEKANHSKKKTLIMIIMLNLLIQQKII